jgi:hypothetical protein
MTTVSLPRSILVGIGVTYGLWVVVQVVPVAMGLLRGRTTGIAFVASPGLLFPLLVGSLAGFVGYWLAQR